MRVRSLATQTTNTLCSKLGRYVGGGLDYVPPLVPDLINDNAGILHRSCGCRGLALNSTRYLFPVICSRRDGPECRKLLPINCDIVRSPSLHRPRIWDGPYSGPVKKIKSLV